MKTLLCAVLALLSGCQADQESRDFFYSGWVNPEQGANRRMYGTDLPPDSLRDGQRSSDLPAGSRKSQNVIGLE